MRTRGLLANALPSLAALPIAVLGPIAAASAQTFEYTIRFLPVPEGAYGYASPAVGLNEVGTVVGYALFDPPPAFKGWVFTEATGTVVLPEPPEVFNWSANDVNNDGVIAGDGGYDGGIAWRFHDGVYESLGTLPGDTVSNAQSINEAGDVAGTSKDPNAFGPKHAAFAPAGGSWGLVADEAYGTFGNETGQVVGYTTGNGAFRFAPEVGVEFLGGLPGRPLSWAWSINNAGEVVGEAAQANGNGHVPFLFTNGGGMQEIGDFGAEAQAVSINDRGEVIGNHTPGGGPHPWIWTAALGVRFLADLYDPASGIGLTRVQRLNERGQIIGHGIDLGTGDRAPVLLTPLLFTDGFESGDTSAWSTTVP